MATICDRLENNFNIRFLIDILADGPMFGAVGGIVALTISVPTSAAIILCGATLTIDRIAVTFIKSLFRDRAKAERITPRLWAGVHFPAAALVTIGLMSLGAPLTAGAALFIIVAATCVSIAALAFTSMW